MLSCPVRKECRMSQSKPPTAVPDRWAALTWEDLERSAGDRSAARGRSYQRGARVRDLTLGADGRLLATVQGTERYAVAVSLQAGGKRVRLQSECTCPVGASGCKHAVALVAAYLQALADGTPVPEADAGDRRWADLAGDTFEDDDDFADQGSAVP